MNILNFFVLSELFIGDVVFLSAVLIVSTIALFHEKFTDSARALRYATLMGLGISLIAFIVMGISNNSALGFNGRYINDAFSIGGKILILVCGIFACVFNKVEEYIKLSNYMFYPLLMVATAGSFLAVGAIGLDVLLIAMGLIVISTSFMVILSSSDKIYSKTNSIFLITQALGFAIFILGVAYVHHLIGSFQYEDVGNAIDSKNYVNKHLMLALVLIISSLSIIMGAVPFSNWAVKIHTAMFDSVAVFLRTTIVMTIILVLARLLYDPFITMAYLWKDFILLIGVCGILIGTFGTLMQQNIDKLYGYVSIGHVGFLFLALSIGNVNSISAIIVYCIAYILSYVAFLGYGRGIFCDNKLVKNLEDLSDAGRSMGMHSLSFAIAGLSFAGLPPFIGFIGKISVLGAVLQWDLPILVAILVISGVLQSMWVLRLFRVMYFTKFKIKDDLEEVPTISFSNKAQKGMVFIRRLTIIISITFLFISGPIIALAHKMSSVF